LLKRVIGTSVGRDVRIIDSAEETAAETAAVLREKGLTHAHTDDARYRFIASDAPEQFLRVGQRVLGASIDRVETVTLG
jgi:glutamate racemase